MSLFSMDASHVRLRVVQAGAAVVAAALIAGCGSAYRPVITPINPSGPPAQPNSLVAVVSSPAPAASSPGVVTILDYSGDTVMARANIGPGPIAFTVDATGSNGYTVNSDHTLTNFQVSSALQEKFVTFSTLPITSQITNLFSPSAGLWAADLDQNVSDVLTGSPATFKLAIPLASTPIAIIGTGSIGQHNYAISQNNSNTPSGSIIPFGVACNNAPGSVSQNGEADALEVSTFTVSARIPLGKCPVYAVATPDGRRVFVLNRGSDTVTVINSQNNSLDACTPFTNQNGQLVTCHPSLPLSTAAGLSGANVPAVAGPVYGEYNAATQQLIVADYDGGTISVIDVSLDIYGDDSQTFGTTFTIPVGKNPASVTALADGSRAYTADQADGTVHVVNLASHKVVKTLGVVGHPRTVVSTSNSLYGKIYVASPDSPYVTILRTDQDIVDTTVLVEGNIVDVRVNTQDATRGNNNNISRVPGGGQPCYLPPALMASTYGAGYTLADCQTLP
jgi:DNA-binding beta-propeller fold protein YncE